MLTSVLWADSSACHASDPYSCLRELPCEVKAPTEMTDTLNKMKKLTPLYCFLFSQAN